MWYDVPGCVEEWHIPSVQLCMKQLSESKKHRQDCLMSSAQSFYGPCLQLVVHFLTCCFSRDVPLLHLQVSFTRPSPALVLQATNAGARRLSEINVEGQNMVSLKGSHRHHWLSLLVTRVSL